MPILAAPNDVASIGNTGSVHLAGAGGTVVLVVGAEVVGTTVVGATVVGATVVAIVVDAGAVRTALFADELHPATAAKAAATTIDVVSSPRISAPSFFVCCSLRADKRAGSPKSCNEVRKFRQNRPMRIELEPVAEADKAVLARLLELYRYDMSDFRPYELSPHGTYGYRYLDAYFLNDDREACFIKVDGELAGFTMTRMLHDNVRSVAEFFVVRRWRRTDVGTTVARQLFARHPGRWEVAVDDANTAGQAFWPAVCGAAAGSAIETRRKPDDANYPGIKLLFET
jgi:predicted acetyltransferase